LAVAVFKIQSERKMKPLQATRTVLALGPQASATTARTANVDAANCSYAKIFVPVNAEANTNSTNVIMEVLHADSTSATFTSLGTNLIDNTAAAVGVANVALNGKGRYIQVKATPDTTTNGAVVVGGIIVQLQQALSPNASTTENTVTYA
jgi:hypothetical protein